MGFTKRAMSLAFTVGFMCAHAAGAADSAAAFSSLAPRLPRERGPTAHVPGYLSTSVVTVRLWLH